jgi:hypothetical protein
MSVALTTVNLLSRIAQARALDQAKHSSGEGAKVGTLRGGTAGIRTESGDIAGKCHRVAHLRSLGLEVDPPSAPQYIMFELGFATEDTLAAQLRSTLAEGEVLLSEDEISVQWTTSNGTVVTGRPDHVICRELKRVSPETGDELYATRMPLLGIEVKSAHSVWTSRDVYFSEEPKLDHLVQAAHYASRLGKQYGDGTPIPYILYYKQHSHQAVPGWAGKLFPRPGTTGSEVIEYNEKGEIKHIKPWEIAYEIRFTQAGRVEFRRESVDTGTVSKWRTTVVTADDITRFYEYVSQMSTTQDLGPRPMTIGVDGKEKNYSTCGYCPLQKTCDQYESRGYEQWLGQVRQQLVGSSSK